MLVFMIKPDGEYSTVIDLHTADHLYPQEFNQIINAAIDATIGKQDPIQMSCPVCNKTMQAKREYL